MRVITRGTLTMRDPIRIDASHRPTAMEKDPVHIAEGVKESQDRRRASITDTMKPTL